ncbi:MAG: hypothetical protein ACOY71_07015 [Gemmatimonadota bacterium]
MDGVELTIPPWDLPVDELRWGRWLNLAEERSVVWVACSGRDAKRWMLVNGVPDDSASVTADRLRGAGWDLELRHEHDLARGSLADVADSIGQLRSVLPASLRSVQVAKWLGRGTFAASGGRQLAGWSVQEVVHFG